MPVAIVTDASVDLSPEQAARFGVGIAPLTYSVDGRRYVTGEQPCDALYEAIAGGADVRIIGVEPDDFEAVFTAAAKPADEAAGEAAGRATGQADEIVCVCQSFGSTFTYVAAEVAARRVSVPMRVVNTGRSGAAQAALAIAAARVAAGGADAARVVGALEAAATRAETYLLPPGLDQLRRSGALAALATPSSGARIEDGVPLLRARGRLSAVDVLDNAASAEAALAERARAAAGDGEVVLVLTHAGAPDAVERLGRALEGRLRVAETAVTAMGPVLASLLGPGAYGAGFCAVPAVE